VVGVSHDFGCVWSAGGYLSYSDSKTEYRNLASRIDADIYQGGVFAQYKSNFSGWVGSLDLSLAGIDNEYFRYAGGQRFDANFDQLVFGAGLEAGYEFSPWANGRVIPFAGLRYQRLHQDAVHERGGHFAINAASSQADSLVSSLGINLAHAFVVGEGSVTPSLTLGWTHEYGDRKLSTSYSYGGGSLVTRADTVNKGRDALEAGFGLSAILARNATHSFGVNCGYNASVGARRVEHNFQAGCQLGF
jgi:outer membrane autotransporter protein